MKSNDAGARVVDKRKNWEARVEMAVFKLPLSELSTYDKLVYAILCGHANRDGNAMLYVRTIAEEASCSERQTRRALSNLEARHLLIRRPQSAAGQGQTFNIYEVYGSDAYIFKENPAGKDGIQAHGMTVRHPLPDSHTSPCQSVIPPLTGGQAPPDSLAEPNNVFEQPLFNSSKDNNIPPTPQGEEREKNCESSKPQSQEYDTEGKDRNQGASQNPPEPSPFLGVLDAFNEILPELPHAETLTSARIKNLNRCIGEDPARKELEWWKRYFRGVRDYPWLMGKNPNGWKANFDWLIGESGMRKVVEGNFPKIPGSGFTEEEKRALQRKYTDERGRVDAVGLLWEWRQLTGEGY
jgi:hypothetical protein